MGLFSFIGKAVKKVAHVVGGAVRIVSKVAQVVPGVGSVIKSAESLASPVVKALHLAKTAKLGIAPAPVFPTLAATAPTATNLLALHKHAKHSHKLSGGKKSHLRLHTTTTKRRKKPSKKRTARKKSGGRRLKFGSPAWRKKYMRKSA